MNIHRVNWMWAQQAGAGQGRRERAAQDLGRVQRGRREAEGRRHHAGGARRAMDWTDGTLLEIIVYGMDIDLYRQAFVDLDLEALRGEGMASVLRPAAQDGRLDGRAAWPAATGTSPRPMLLQRRIRLPIPWATGRSAPSTAPASRKARTICAAARRMNVDEPGFILNSDSVMFFKADDPDYQEGQDLLAHLIMSPEFQTIFNQAKGSIPARMDVDLSKGFNPCQQQSQEDLQATVEAGTLVVSMAHNMAVAQKFRGAMLEVITEFVNDPRLAPEDAASPAGRRRRRPALSRRAGRDEPADQRQRRRADRATSLGTAGSWPPVRPRSERAAVLARTGWPTWMPHLVLTPTLIATLRLCLDLLRLDDLDLGLQLDAAARLRLRRLRALCRPVAEPALEHRLHQPVHLRRALRPFSATAIGPARSPS